MDEIAEIVPFYYSDGQKRRVADLMFTHSGLMMFAAMYFDDYTGGQIGGQLAQYDGENIHLYTESIQYIMDIAEDSRNTLWIASDLEGLVHKDGDIWRLYTTYNSELKSNRVRGFAIDAHDNVWVRYLGVDGCSCFNRESWTFYSIGHVNNFSPDKYGGVWASTGSSVYYFFDGSFKQIYEVSDDGPQSIGNITLDLAGVIWISSSNGFFMYDEGIWRPFCNIEKITAVDVGVDNTKWVGNFYNELYSIALQTGPFVNIVTPNGGTILDGGTTAEIRWTSYDVDTVDISYSRDDGETWLAAATGVDASSGSYTWVIPDVYTAECRLKISDPGNPDVWDVSDGIMTIDSETGVDDELPVEFALYQNHPNPFNPSTTINFTLPESGHATLTVFNLAGQTVRTLVDEPMAAGNHTIVWDGRDDAGNAVAAGVYLTQLNAGGRVAAGKMVLVK